MILEGGREKEKGKEERGATAMRFMDHMRECVDRPQVPHGWQCNSTSNAGSQQIQAHVAWLLTQ